MKPLTRKEYFMQAIAKGEKPAMPPLTREEALLAEQAKQKGKGVSWNDLEDKPFGKTETIIELIPEQTVTFSDGVANVFPEDVSLVNELEVGDEVVLICDGVETKGYLSQHGSGLPWFNENTYFSVLCNKTQNVFTLYQKRTLNAATIQMYKIANEYRTLDPTYLPKAAVVADAAGDTPTAAEFNALLASLRAAGYLEENAL